MNIGTPGSAYGPGLPQHRPSVANGVGGKHGSDADLLKPARMQIMPKQRKQTLSINRVNMQELTRRAHLKMAARGMTRGEAAPSINLHPSAHAAAARLAAHRGGTGVSFEILPRPERRT